MWYNSPIKFLRNGKKFKRISKIKNFINKYNWEGINYLSEKGEKKNPAVALNILYAKKEKTYFLLTFQSVKSKLFL